MVKFEALIGKFGKKGEKSGWTYIYIDSETANRIKPKTKKSFRVKGKLDSFTVEGISLIPMGNGDFILPLNASIRKEIKKQKGEKVLVQITEDKKEFEPSKDFLDCLKEEKSAQLFFESLAKSHQNYFSKWIESAKTDITKAKRIAKSINGLKLKMGYPEMIRYYKNQ